MNQNSSYCPVNKVQGFAFQTITVYAGGAWPSSLNATCWKFVPSPPPSPFFLSCCLVFTSKEKSGKNMPMAEILLLCLSLYESERGNSTQSTAVGSLQYFLILSAVQTQTAFAPDPSFSPSDSLSRIQQSTNILVSCASGHSSRGQALGQLPVTNT